MKTFYTLTEIETLEKTDIKYRQLKKRMKTHLDNGTLRVGEHLYRIGWAWQIHYSLLCHFQAKYPTKK